MVDSSKTLSADYFSGLGYCRFVGLSFCFDLLLFGQMKTVVG